MRTILRQERWIVVGCLAALVIAAWAYIVYLRVTMPADMDMPGMVMLDTRAWSAVDLVLLFLMWAVMMVAMMTPSAAPMLLAFLSLNHSRRTSGRPLAPVGLFLAGYLATWTAYSAAATLAQWGLHQAALLTTMMESMSPAVNGVILLAAGIYQWTPLKRACLSGCRSPLTFLMSEWRDGRRGAFIMGLRHGSYCVGCCWILMALLFVTGVMNLFWIALIALFVLAEKSLANGMWFSRITGAALFVMGVAVMTGATRT